MNRRVLIVAACGACISAISMAAQAQPFKETLSKDEVSRVTQAVRDAANKRGVDQPKMTKCQASYDIGKLDTGRDPTTTASLADCYDNAGAITLVILLREQVSIADPRKQPSDILRKLGAIYEKAAKWQEAADAYERYVMRPPIEPLDAREVLIRAACIYRQLGDERGAGRVTQMITRLPPAGTSTPRAIQPDTMCDRVRPIAMPGS